MKQNVKALEETMAKIRRCSPEVIDSLSNHGDQLNTKLLFSTSNLQCHWRIKWLLLILSVENCHSCACNSLGKVFLRLFFYYLFQRTDVLTELERSKRVFLQESTNCARHMAWVSILIFTEVCAVKCKAPRAGKKSCEQVTLLIVESGAKGSSQWLSKVLKSYANHEGKTTK